MLFVFTIVFFLSTLFYYLNINILASVIMVALAIFLCFSEYQNTKRIVSIKGFFALGFIGGFGVSLLKLSKLSSGYSMLTFLAIFIAYYSLYFGTYIASRKKKETIKKNKQMEITVNEYCNQDILLIVLIIVSTLSFIIEAVVLGFVPLLSIGVPHAYSTFHIFLVHYITTLYVFVPSIAICNFYVNKNKLNFKIIIFTFAYAVVMSLLMVSRAQLILTTVLAIFTFLIFNCNKIKKIIRNKKVIIAAAVTIFIFLILYILITISRSHNIEYLKGIFEMKNDKIPIFIIQPYMYIAHNFENLNYMINNTFRWTFGRRTLYPFFTLSLIKKFFPIVVDSPYYIIKPELSTVTLIYDFYYDFGLVGVLVFCFIIGFMGKKLEDRVYESLRLELFYKNNYLVILFALYAYFMLFSFFQAYFSLTDTWVHIILLVILSAFFIMNKKVALKRKEKKK